MARDHLPHGSMVGWFMPLNTSLPHGFLERERVLSSSSWASCDTLLGGIDVFVRLLVDRVSSI